MKINEEELHLSICDKLIDIGIMFQEDGLVYTLIGLTCGRKVQYFGRTNKIMIDFKPFMGTLEDLK